MAIASDDNLTGPGSDPRIGDDEERQGRSFGTLGTVLLIVIVVIIVLLLWRSCAPGGTSGETFGGDRIIQELEDLESIPDGVAVWVRPDADIETVLARNGLADAEAADLGDGTWVIGIGDRDAVATVNALKGDPGLYDAGFIYLDGSTP